MTALELAQILENTNFSDFSVMTEAEGNDVVAHVFVESHEGETFRVVVKVDTESLAEDECDVFG